MYESTCITAWYPTGAPEMVHGGLAYLPDVLRAEFFYFLSLLHKIPVKKGGLLCEG